MAHLEQQAAQHKHGLPAVCDLHLGHRNARRSRGSRQAHAPAVIAARPPANARRVAGWMLRAPFGPQPLACGAALGARSQRQCPRPAPRCGCILQWSCSPEQGVSIERAVLRRQLPNGECSGAACHVDGANVVVADARPVPAGRQAAIVWRGGAEHDHVLPQAGRKNVIVFGRQGGCPPHHAHAKAAALARLALATSTRIWQGGGAPAQPATAPLCAACTC